MAKRNPFEAQLKDEGLDSIDKTTEFLVSKFGRVGSAVTVKEEKGSQAASASPGNWTLTAEMSAAIHDIVDHPALEKRHREILRAYLDCDCNWDAVAKKARCSMSKISEVIERVKTLMLHPDELPTAVDVSDEDDTVELHTPPEAALSFEDIEASLELSAKTAHRIIKAVAEVSVIGNGELKANESATRTLVLLRRAEMECLSKGGRKAKATNEDLHEVASQNKVEK
jgi:hypothetical protein